MRTSIPRPKGVVLKFRQTLREFATAILTASGFTVRTMFRIAVVLYGFRKLGLSIGNMAGSTIGISDLVLDVLMSRVALALFDLAYHVWHAREDLHGLRQAMAGYTRKAKASLRLLRLLASRVVNDGKWMVRVLIRYGFGKLKKLAFM